MNDGETFKYIRTARNISQQDICNSFISRTTLSKFENDKTSLSKNNFEFLLSSLDITYEEFNYIKNDYGYSKKDNILSSYLQITSVYDKEAINSLIVECQEFLTNNFSISVNYLLKILHILDNDNSDTIISDVTKKYAQEIWNELSKIELWTILDIKIIKTCLFYFEPETFNLLSQQLIKALKKYEDFTDVDTLKFEIHSNITILFLLNGDVERAKYFSELTLTEGLKIKRIDYISIAMIRYGLLLKNTSELEKGLALLDIYGENNFKSKTLEEKKLIEEILQNN